MVNLIANAIKFTHKGHVELSIDCPQKTESDCSLIIHVKDTGIGITEEAQAIIFNEFSQADESHTREYGGTGLGLAISKRIIEKMGGTLTVSSKPNEGSVFSFSASFPLVKDEEVGDAAPDQPALKNFTFSNTPHVLVVEDNLVNQRVITMIIEKAGCRVAIARNGKQAIEYLHLNDPPDERPRCDVILMDIQMPVMDGLQATEIIRQSDPTIPIIALTAHAMKGDREKFIQAKMNDYLSTPIQKEELLHLLRQHTGLA